MKPLKTLILPLLYICALSQPAWSQNHAQIKILPETSHIAAGQTIALGIVQTLDKGWHSYWHNPGDSGTPLEIEWTLPAGFETQSIQWPTPHKIPFGPLTNYGYEEQVTLLQGLRAPENLPAGPLKLEAEITLLVCADICIPETTQHTLTLNEGPVIDNSAVIKAAQASMPRAADWPAAFSEDKDNLKLTITPPAPGALDAMRMETLALIPEEWGVVENSAPVLAARDEQTLTLRQKRGERAFSELETLRTLLTYTDQEGAYQGLIITASKETPAAAVTQAPAASTPGTSFIAAMLFAVLGGLILNLMPCVFPVLSLKVMALSRMSDKEQAHAVTSGLTYTAGVVLSFAAIAGVLMLLKSAGAQIGWGFQLQNPSVVYALALLLFVIGLNLSGVFQLQGRFTNAGAALAGQSGLTGTFFTGVLATLVATPCTAPFMGAAMGYALTQSAIAGMAVFVALGFGLALPYLLLTLLPPLRKLMPKPGHWMETFKEFLAFPMYASAAWLVWVLAQQTGSMSVLAALIGFVAVAFTFWAWPRRPASAATRLLVSLLIATILATGLGLGFYETLKKHAAPQPTALGGVWQDFSQKRLDELLAGDDPVFVDMTAAWCITCKVNERVALDIPQTHQLWAARNVTPLKGDWTNQNPEITKFLESHGRKGVPLYVYYGPRGPDGQRPAPVILPQILTPALVASAIK